MLEIIGGPGTGKTRKLLEAAYAEGAVVVCSNPRGMLSKAHSYGIPDVKFISYEEFFQGIDPDIKIMIDEIENIYECFNQVVGFTLTKEN